MGCDGAGNGAGNAAVPAASLIGEPLGMRLRNAASDFPDGDGVQTLGLEAGVQFDVRTSGLPMQTGWVSAQDGLLVMDRNADGSINDGSELFGSATTLADGSKAAITAATMATKA